METASLTISQNEIPSWTTRSTLTMECSPLFCQSGQAMSSQPELMTNHVKHALTGTQEYRAPAWPSYVLFSLQLGVNQSTFGYYSYFLSQPWKFRLSFLMWIPKRISSLNINLSLLYQPFFPSLRSQGNKCSWILSKDDLSGQHFLKSL